MATPKIKYPKKEGDRSIYVRYPVMLTEADKGKYPFEVTPGNYVAVDVLSRGYRRLKCPVEHPDFETCLKACNVTNKLHGYTPEQVVSIISNSMGLPELIKVKTPII